MTLKLKSRESGEEQLGFYSRNAGCLPCISLDKESRLVEAPDSHPDTCNLTTDLLPCQDIATRRITR